MKQIFLPALLTLASVASTFADDSSASPDDRHGDGVAGLPEDVRAHMATMVGSWTFKGHQGQRRFRGEETIRLTSGGTALLQEGFFDLGNGGKEHYIIVSGWDAEKKTILVRGFTSDGATWTGEWKTVENGVWKGTASDGKATFEVKPRSMRYEDAGDGTPWVSEFARK